jgi:hypothetical protein
MSKEKAITNITINITQHIMEKKNSAKRKAPSA